MDVVITAERDEGVTIVKVGFFAVCPVHFFAKGVYSRYVASLPIPNQMNWSF